MPSHHPARHRTKSLQPWRWTCEPISWRAQPRPIFRSSVITGAVFGSDRAPPERFIIRAYIVALQPAQPGRIGGFTWLEDALRTSGEMPASQRSLESPNTSRRDPESSYQSLSLREVRPVGIEPCFRHNRVPRHPPRPLERFRPLASPAGSVRINRTPLQARKVERFHELGDSRNSRSRHSG